MLTRRIVPCLDVRGGRIVKGVRFQGLRDAGDPVEVARRYKDKPVYPALNTEFMGASERPGVWAERCQGCGNCVLHLTGGIFPITRCSKSKKGGASNEYHCSRFFCAGSTK